MINTRLLLMTS